MGYTHYYTINESFTENEVKECNELITKILNTTSVSIHGSSGTGSPVITSDYISLNGEDMTDESHETFYVAYHLGPTQTSQFEFCKTARKPYDEVVTACLIAIKHVVNNKIDISSDGFKNEWTPGITLFEEATQLDSTPVIAKIFPPDEDEEW